jgi:hypothetical protein
MGITKVVWGSVLTLSLEVGANMREGSRTFRGQGRRTASSRGMYAWAVLFTSVLLGSSSACLAGSQVVALDPGQSINLSQLTPVNGSSVLVGDKLFGNFSFQYSDTDTNLLNDLQPSAFSLTALSNTNGFGVSFTGPMSAIGNVTEDIVFRFSVTVTNSSQLISDVHLDYDGTVLGSGFSSVVETVFTGGFGGTPIDQINVFNLGSTNQLGAAANLPVPQQEIYIEKDVILGGGAAGSQNAALITIIDQTFSQIPEPSTLLLSVAGLATLFFVKQRKWAVRR